MREILKVLIIDDTDSDRLSVRRSLRHAGFDVDITEVSDGRTAIETLRQTQFDVAFLDFKLPDGDGLDVLKEARAAGVKTPIIAFTAFGSEDVAVELMKAGATDYLSKNRTSADTVKQCVRRAMALRQLQREKEQALRALVNSEKLTRSVINSLPQFVIVVDRSGNVINVNDACDQTLASLFKLGDDGSLLGRNIDDLPKLAPPACRKAFAAAFKSAQSVLKRTRQLVEREIDCGPDKALRMRVTPLMRDTGGAVILMMDVTNEMPAAAN